MKAQTTSKDSLILRQEVLGSRRPSNYFWAVIVSIGGLGFLLAGLSSYLKVNLLLVSDTSALQFIPQGVALLFYGTAGSLLALYLWLSLLWNVGGGYNEFNKETGKVKIFRWSYPGKNRRIDLDWPSKMCKLYGPKCAKDSTRNGNYSCGLNSVAISL
jgi:hypothetical protein